jgi:deoxyribonuclease-1
MANKILLLLCILALSANATSFSKSKKILLKKVYFDNMVSFYCDNPYEIKQLKGKEKTLIIQDEKFYTPRNKYYKNGNINTRTQRMGACHASS